MLNAVGYHAPVRRERRDRLRQIKDRDAQVLGTLIDEVAHTLRSTGIAAPTPTPLPTPHPIMPAEGA